ncbi:MAG: 7-dehydrocholesterol reductase [Gammaproteobacteria bacterium]|nr:7-dehydrocholesterol reductase [Gammaproteobacteria bacterium]
MMQKIRNSLGPLFLILVCPPFAILMWYTNTALSGSFLALGSMIEQQGFFSAIYAIWRPVMFGSHAAWMILSVFAVFELVLMRLLPGKTFYGPITPKGNVPVYKANGVAAFFTTMATFCVASFGLNLFPANIIYDNFGNIIGALNIFSLFFCLFLYLKGRFIPSSTDSGTTGNFIFDYYWGTELYPSVLGWNIKKFINCRFGMMSWGIILLSYAAKQHELTGLSDSMIVSVALQLIYITKFFCWETGYLHSLDIMHDRAGFYICWGCLVWVPCIYTSPSMYLVLHPIHLGMSLAITIFALGAGSILINYLADRQRQVVRATQGDCKIWGKPPVTTLATYRTERGDVRQNLLLASGWWGVARHFHYIPEIAGAFFWSVPALFDNFSPYFYVSFLTLLLFDRAFRDDKRCAKKYGAYWEKYCKIVPYKIVPFIV